MPRTSAGACAASVGNTNGSGWLRPETGDRHLIVLRRHANGPSGDLSSHPVYAGASARVASYPGKVGAMKPGLICLVRRPSGTAAGTATSRRRCGLAPAAVGRGFASARWTPAGAAGGLEADLNGPVREAAQSTWIALSARAAPLSVGTLALSSIGLSTARQVSIAGMTQPISAQAIGPRPDSSGGCHEDVA